MSWHPIYLAKYRLSPFQRAHFAIFIPNLEDASKHPNDRSTLCKGTLINVVGAPMAGYIYEFKRDHCCAESKDLEKLVQIGALQARAIAEDELNEQSTAEPFEKVALQLPAPGRNENFMAPVNNVSLT